MDGEKQCDYCEGLTCECLNTMLEVMPQIKDYREKGRGLQAVAHAPGGIAYNKDDFLGVLAGVIVPPDTYDDDLTLNFVRPDVTDEPVVCQIRVAEVGNCFRLLNHDKDPNARLLPKRRRGCDGC